MGAGVLVVDSEGVMVSVGVPVIGSEALMVGVAVLLRTGVYVGEGEGVRVGVVVRPCTAGGATVAVCSTAAEAVSWTGIELGTAAEPAAAGVGAGLAMQPVTEPARMTSSKAVAGHSTPLLCLGCRGHGPVDEAER